MSLALVTTMIVAAASVGSFLSSVRSGRRAEAHAAREEALALAETRAKVIAELQERLRALEGAYRAQRLTTMALLELVAEIADDLESGDVDAARARLRPVA